VKNYWSPVKSETGSVILSKFWSRYDFQNFRKRTFLGDDQGELSKPTVRHPRTDVPYRVYCRPRATTCPWHPGTPMERRGGARGRRGGGLGAGRGAHRAAPGAHGRRNRSKTAQVPLGETVQGDPGDPPGRSETPSGQPQQPLGGAGWLDWPAGTSRGRHAANRLNLES
jgi:hypothetical protein